MQIINKLKIIHIVTAGLIAETCFELYAWLVSPIIFGLSLQPAKLVIALSQQFLNLQISYNTAFVIHFLIGSIGFSTFVYLFHKIIRTPLIVSGLLSGITLWFIAQGVLAPAIGRSFMMDFGAYTQSSFVGHVGMTLIVAAVFKMLDSRNSPIEDQVAS